ncbi:hypothetical protein [Streptomyces bacillaris]|uniref:hypothetical protein n=1 Tax=Streptomyces bacillaris TaxID=68179 RepID=UPI003460B4F3
MPEKPGSFLIRCTQLVVWKVRNTSIHGECTQMYVNGYVRTANKIADVVDALLPYPLHRAQSGAIGLVIEPRVQVIAGIHLMRSEKVGNGMGRRDLLNVAELHGHGQVFRDEPALEAANRSCVRPARLEMEKSRSESLLVLAPGLEADVADDSTHMGPSTGLGKRTTAE